MANSRSSGSGQLKQPVAMALPSVAVQFDWLPPRAAGFLLGRIALQPLVRAPAVIIPLIQPELPLQILDIPKKQMIQILPAEGSDQPFDERMRPGNMRHRSHHLHPQHPEIGLPALELEQRIVVETESDRQTSTGQGLVEHAA